MKKLSVLLGFLAVIALAQADLVGEWDFNDPADLAAATVGPDLALTGSQTAVAGVNATDGAVRIGEGSHYTVTPGIAGNGGGSFVNEWTLVYDIKCPLTKKYSALLQTTIANNDDGDLFVKKSTDYSKASVGVGDTGYALDAIAADTWYRLVVRVDNGNFYELWLNGGRIIRSEATWPVDGRYALQSQFYLFADNDGEEDTIDVSLVALYDTALSEADIEGLGSAGTPLSYHALNVSPVRHANGVLPTATLEWKSPRDPNNVDVTLPKLNTHSFVVYCDPNLVRLKDATYDSHEGVPYFADQLLVGDIADDPIQSYDPAPDLSINTTYFWRVDTRITGAEPNDVIAGDIWSFNTNQTPEDVVAHSGLVKPGEADGNIVVTASDPAGVGLSYQWYLDPDPTSTGDEVELSDGAAYAGVDTDTLTVIDPSVENEEFYVCDVSNSGGTVRSNSARVVIGRLVNHYELDGNLTDSASGYDAVLITTGKDPDWPTGHVGTNAMELYGDKGAIIDLEQFASSPYPTTGQEFTITAWVYADASPSGWASILKHWNGSVSRGMFHLGLESSGTKLDLQVDQSDGTEVRIIDSAEFPTEQWQFVAAVADGTSIHLYRMGADEAVSNRKFEVGAADYDGTLNYTTTRWVGIGCKPAAEGSGDAPGADPAAPGFWNGILDDIQVYNYGLSAEQVADIYGSSVCLYSTNPADPHYLNTTFDLNADCKISLEDFVFLASNWLMTGIYTPVQ